MDLDSLINLLVLFMFLVLPAILKRRQAKGKKADSKPGPGAKKKKGQLFSLLGKLWDQIRAHIKELERQARLAEQKSGKNVWEDLEDSPLEGEAASDDLFREESFEPAEEEPKPFVRPDPGPLPPPTPRVPRPEPGVAPLPGPGSRRSSRLRRAVIWSEILGKPVALKKMNSCPSDSTGSH